MSSSNSKKVSIILPFYSLNKNIYNTVESLLNQTYENIEVIIVDNTQAEEIVLDINNDRVTIIKRCEVQRAFYARNKGISHATGDYISIVDCGDEVLPDHLEIAVDHIEKNNVDVYSTGYVNIYPNGTSEFRTRNRASPLTVFELLLFNPIGHSSVVMKKSSLIVYPEYDLRHDLALWIRLLKKGLNFEINSIIKMKRYISNKSISAKKYKVLYWLIQVYRNETGFSWYRSAIYLSLTILIHSLRYIKIKVKELYRAV